MQSRWLSNNRANTTQETKTPDIESMDMDTYTRSLHAMNDSLHDLQSDIHRLVWYSVPIIGHRGSFLFIHRPPSPLELLSIFMN